MLMYLIKDWRSQIAAAGVAEVKFDKGFYVS